MRLFGVVGQVLVKPHLLRDVDSEFDAFHMEEASVRRKLAATKEGMAAAYLETQRDGYLEEHITKGTVRSPTVNNNNTKLYQRVHLQEHKYDAGFLYERLKEIKADKNELGKTMTIRCGGDLYLFTRLLTFR